MRTERVLLTLAFACAAFLLLAPLTPRTTWLRDGLTPFGEASSFRDGAGWDWLSGLCGLAAMVALGAGAAARSRAGLSAAAAVAAAAAFAVAARAAAAYWADLAGGAADLADYVTRPAPGPPYFAAVAAAGAVAALALAAGRLRPGPAGS